MVNMTQQIKNNVIEKEKPDNSARFIRDLSSYLVDIELSEVDKRKIKGMFERASNGDPIVVKEKVVEYRDRIVNKYIYINRGDKREKQQEFVVSPGDVREFILERFGIPDFDTYPTRKRTYSDARKMYCYLLRAYAGMVWKDIGDLLASRSRTGTWDHSDALKAAKAFERVRKTDFKFKPLYQQFLQQFNLSEHDNPNGQTTDGITGDTGLPGSTL
jgi:chromosomal replication initiation ATPase DnaA